MTGVQTCALPICFPVTICRLCKRISVVKRELNKLYKIGSGLSDGYYECVFEDQNNRLSLGNGNYVVIIPRIDY